MSTSAMVISLTDEDTGTEAAVRLDGADLRGLRKALKASGSTATTRLAGAIEHAIAHHKTLVLGYGEAASEQDEGELVARVGELIDQLTPDLDFPSESAIILARRNAKRRTELLREFGALSGEQIAEERSRAANRHALAARWRKEGRVFGVPYRGQTLYPAFQFDDDGGLRPVIAEVLAALPRDRMSAWEVALWWTSANGSLGGDRPVDLLDERAGALPDAARRLAEPLPV